MILVTIPDENPNSDDGFNDGWIFWYEGGYKLGEICLNHLVYCYGLPAENPIWGCDVCNIRYQREEDVLND